MNDDRSRRQEAVFKWVTDAFGPDHANSASQRATRFLDEAIELFQVCGGDPQMAHRLIDYIFAKPAGELRKELGDVGLTLLSVAALHNIDADMAERAAVIKVLATDPAEMRERNRAKNEAGLDAQAYPVIVYPSSDPDQVRKVKEHLGIGRYSRTPCLCGERREEDCKPNVDCERLGL